LGESLLGEEVPLSHMLDERVYVSVDGTENGMRSGRSVGGRTAAERTAVSHVNDANKRKCWRSQLEKKKMGGATMACEA
jgi:hypothetical protein